MRRLFLVAVLLAALAAVPAVSAQVRGTPASVTSSNPRWTSTAPAASVTSLGPHGFGDFRGRGFGHHGFGRRDFGRHSGFGVSVGFGRNPRVRIHFGSRRRFHHRRPVFVPVYVPYYYPYYPVAYAQPAPVAEPVYYDDTYDDPRALTVDEQRSQYIRRDQYPDSRYGEHYFDPRDEARRELEERDARVRQRREAQEEQYAPAPREENAAAAPEPEEDVPTTVLVFRDGTRREVKNYAIVGDTLWELSASRARKVPLAELNLQATIRENEERGVDFRLPKSAATSSAPRLPNLLSGR
jgi:hypothetical protein